MAEKECEGSEVDLSVEVRMSTESLELRPEEEGGPQPAVVQGLLSHAIAREIQPLLVPVEESECEHPVEG